MKEITVNRNLSQYGAARSLWLLLGVTIYIPAFVMLVWVSLELFVNPIGVLIAAISLFCVTYWLWWSFGPKYAALRRQQKNIIAADDRVRHHWFEITSQQWMITPVVDLDGVAKMQDCWYATFRANGSELAVMWEKEWVEKHGLTEGKAPTHIKFPHAHYSDTDGKLVLDAKYGFFSLKY